MAKNAAKRDAACPEAHGARRLETLPRRRQRVNRAREHAARQTKEKARVVDAVIRSGYLRAARTPGPIHWRLGMKCPRCQQHNPSHAMFCLQCGAPVRRSAGDDASEASYTELQRSLTEALARESATGEILRVLSGSPTAIQPVLDAIAGSAARLCGSLDANIFQRDGGQLVLIAHHGPIPGRPIGEFTVPMILGTAAGRAVLEGRAVHVADMQTRGEEFREGSEIARRHGDRTILAVPLIREGSAIGVIVLRRAESRLFTDRQVSLLQTFADQAVIAIENVRLFSELQEKNRALTQAHGQVTAALEQHTATSDILRVISSSPTDVQPVFDAIVRSAVRLVDGLFGALYRFDGSLIHFAAHDGFTPEGLTTARRAFPLRPTREVPIGRTILEGAVVHVPDAQAEWVPTAKRTWVSELFVGPHASGRRMHWGDRGRESHGRPLL
jgi:GAF domain